MSHESGRVSVSMLLFNGTTWWCAKCELSWKESIQFYWNLLRENFRDIQSRISGRLRLEVSNRQRYERIFHNNLRYVQFGFNHFSMSVIVTLNSLKSTDILIWNNNWMVNFGNLNLWSCIYKTSKTSCSIFKAH